MADHLVVRIAVAFALAAAIGCDDPGPVEEIRFGAPERIEVVAGTTLAEVAEDQGVTVDELKLWNGLEADRLADDTVLLLWKPIEIEPVDPAPPPPRARRAPKPARVVQAEAPTAAAEAEAAAEGEALAGAARIAVEAPSSVRSAGVLSALGEIEDGADLSGSVAALDVRGKAPGAAGLSRRGQGLAGRGTAETLTDVGRTPRTYVGPDIGSGPIRVPSLPMPPKKACLPPPTADQLQRNDGYVANTSLTDAQIRAAMASFVPKTMPCIPAGTKGSYEIETQLKVGCDGRVADVWIIDSGALPDNVGECVAEALRFASFPAHAVPDGVVFAYPIVYRY